MKRVTKPAEDVTHIPTVNKQNKDTAFTGSVPDGNASNRGGEEKEEDKTHGFSKTLAQIKNAKDESLGWNAVIILRYLSAISRKYGRNIDGKRWVRVNLDHISKQYPYIGRSTVDDNILRLEQFGCCEKQNGVAELKSRKNDRTRCYHIPKKWMDAAEEEPRYFRSSVAEHLSVPAAVIFYNFCHWIGECKERKVECHVKLSPATLVELLPFSESTIKRCLKTLEAEKYIHPVQGKICWYAEKTQELRGPNPDDKGSKPDDKGPNPDEKGPNPDNYMYCNELVDELKKNSKPKPAASVFENPADDTKANEDTIHLFDEGISPCADEQTRKKMRHEKITSGGSEFNSSSAASQETGQTRSFSFVDAPVSFQKANAAPISKDHSPSTADITNEVDGKWAMVDSLEELHQINHQHSDAVEKLVLQPDTCETFRETILNICAKTMAMADLGIVDELYNNPDGDDIIEAVLPHFHEFLDQTTLDPSTGLSQIIYHAALECMVGSFLWKENKMGYTHPMRTLIGVTYKLSIVLWRRAETLREHAIKEEFDEWKHEYASVDEHKENDVDLSPAEKMHVFRNALNARNKVGWIFYDQTHQTHKIQVSKKGCERIQKLFALNPDLTPAELLPIMDKCMETYCAWPSPPKQFRKGDWWHSRMGHRLHMFASYLKTIVKELKMVSPVKVYLAKSKSSEKDVALAA